MAMLKTIVAHKGAKGQSTRRIEDYLRHGSSLDTTASAEDYLDHGHGRKERIAGFANSTNLDEALAGGQTGWADAMDLTRQMWDKDYGRLWYHQIVSPDPADHVGPEECLALASEWAERAHPGYEWVVAVHTDSDSGIVHAHVITNSVHPETGRKLQISNQDVVRETRVLSQLCERHGLTPMEDIVAYRERARRETRGTRPDRSDMATRAIVRSGRRSWVEETKDAINRAVEDSLGWNDFVTRMTEQGWRLVPNRDGDVTYYHPESRGFDLRVKARRLGREWCKEAVVSRMGVNWDALLDRTWDDWAKGFESPLAYRLVSERHLVRKVAIQGRRAGRATLEVRLGSPYAAARTKNIEAMLRAIATVRSEGAGSMQALNAKAGQVGLELDRASAVATEMMRAARQVEEAMEAMGRRDALASELGALPEGTWSLATRQKRNALRDELAAADAKVTAVLEPCKLWLAREGHGGEPNRDQLLAVATRLRERAADAGGRASDLAGRLAALREAQSVAERTLVGPPAVRSGIAGAAPVPAGRLPKAGTSMVKTAQAEVARIARAVPADAKDRHQTPDGSLVASKSTQQKATGQAKAERRIEREDR